MKPKAIVIVDSRGILSSENNYDLKRHIDYANRVTKADKELRFIVATTNPSLRGSTKLGELEVIGFEGNKRLSPWFIYSVIKFINRQGFGKLMMIAGDPWESAMNVQIIGRFIPTKFTTQVQIHADITSSAWAELSWINRLRKFLLLFTLSKFDSIRVTSGEILIAIAELYRIPQNKIFVSNLRLNLEPEARSEQAQTRPRTISFVGRLDKDRGLEKFVEIVKTVAELDLHINIVGAGAYEQEFKYELEEILGTKKIHFWGELKPQDMASIWNQSGILISTAPSESFGRTIREAVCFGIPVMGVPSRGFKEFTSFASVPWVRILDPEWNKEEFRANVEELLRIETSLVVREKILKIQEEQTDTLIKEWLSLLEIKGPFK